jgi:hypothetical protein
MMSVGLEESIKWLEKKRSDQDWTDPSKSDFDLEDFGGGSGVNGGEKEPTES